MELQHTGHLLRAPVWIGMSGQDQVRTASNSLWGSMGLDQRVQVTELMRSQVNRTLEALMMHVTPP